MLPVAVLAGGVIAYAAISSQRETPPLVDTVVKPPSVETVPVRVHTGGLPIETDGLVVPHREIHLSAEVGGRITFKADECRAGRFVKAGQPLLTIDPRQYQLEVQRLEREREQAEVAIREADVELANTETLIGLAQEKAALQQKQLERAKKLFANSANSEAELEQIQQTELAARQDLTTLRNQLRKLQTSREGLVAALQLVEARLAQARLDVDRTQVTAPTDGMVVSQSVEKDDYVAPGAELIVIEDTSAVEVRCQLRIDELAWLWLQQQPASADPSIGSSSSLDYQLPRAPVTVTYRVQGHRYQWDGELSRFEGIGLDERTRTVPCRVLVSNPRSYRADSQSQSHLVQGAGPRALLRGMYVELTIHAQPNATLLKVPERTIQPGNTVWRVRDGKLDIVPLANVRLLDDMALLPAAGSPLEPGDLIVTSPLAAVVEGMQVEPRPIPPAGEKPLAAQAQETSRS